MAEGAIPTFTVAAFSATGSGPHLWLRSRAARWARAMTAPFRCTADIHSVTVTLSEHVPVNPMVEFERIMAEQ